MFYTALAGLFNTAWERGPPPGWNCLSLHSIHKGGSPQDANNYRGIAVMGTIPKLLAHILLPRLPAHSDACQLRSPMQTGFKRGAQLEGNALILITILQWAHQLCLPLYALFVDLTKAYNRIDRGQLWDILLHQLGVEAGLLS